jgi:hypothetical protein
LGWLFDSLGLPAEKSEKQQLHREIVALLGMEDDAHCPEVWAELKERYTIDTKTQSPELAGDLAARLGR